MNPNGPSCANRDKSKVFTSGVFNYQDDAKKPPVPKKDEKPIQGLVSDKNYIVANAVENILAGKGA